MLRRCRAWSTKFRRNTRKQVPPLDQFKARKNGARRAPSRRSIPCCLEGELRHQSYAASVAGDHRPRVIEVGIVRLQIVQVARAVRASGERVYIIHTQPLARIASGDE